MTNYYLDPAGSDTAIGTSPATAWKTLAKGSAFPYMPGDSLLLNRGTTQTVKGKVFPFTRSGAAGNPIIIGAYGSGARPTIQLDPAGQPGEQQVFYFTGVSYVSIMGLHLTLINPYRSPDGQESVNGVPTGQDVKFGWYVGVNWVSGQHVTVEDCEMDHLSVGIFPGDNTQAGVLAYNDIHDLDAFWVLGGAAGPMGAVAIMPHGNDHQIYENDLHDNFVECIKTADGLLASYGAPFEPYNLNRAHIHHNHGTQFRKSLEFGRDAFHTCDDNIVEDNLFVSDRVDARGPNIHGPAAFGPCLRTIIRRNTVVLTGARSEAAVIGTGAAGTQVYDNILQAVAKAIFLGAGGGIEHHTLYWGGQVQIINGAMSPTSKKANPMLDADYKPLPGSPALGMSTDGGTVGAPTKDQGDDLMSVITELQAVENDLRLQADALKAQADKIAAQIAALQVVDDQLDAAALAIDPN